MDGKATIILSILWHEFVNSVRHHVINHSVVNDCNVRVNNICVRVNDGIVRMRDNYISMRL